jgi:transforming growth factor-beta-induced protein
MKTLFATALLATCFTVGCAESTAPKATKTAKDAVKKAMPQKDIVDTAIAAGSFKTLVTAVKAAGLVETLKSPGPFTVFAPTDEAFKKLPPETLAALLKPEAKGKLANILKYHVVPQKVMAAQAVKLTSAPTALEGKTLTIKVEGETVMIDGAKVIKTDIVCKNGVIHVIDAVVLPKD